MNQLDDVRQVLEAFEQGLGKYGSHLERFHRTFTFSDDTEEAIVLFNHLLSNEGKVDVDKLALEFAKRYVERDGDGETYGYGLMTRKVLRDIYEGTPWWEANKTYRKSEGTSSHVDDLVNALVDKKKWDEVADMVQKKIHQEKAAPKEEKVGSCGNGAVMRIAPLGALLSDKDPKEVAEQAVLSCLPTHEHPEAFAGAVAIAELARVLATDDCKDKGIFQHLINVTPESQVRNGIQKCVEIPVYQKKVDQAVAYLGNGMHVTCQDTVPLCCWLVVRGIHQRQTFEQVISDTTACQGDVDTTCAIVGGLYGIKNDPPEKWVNYCKPMEGVIEC
jgi:ADP-ribosylglycohydrolase